MEITRRGFFGVTAAAAIAPFVPITKTVAPEIDFTHREYSMGITISRDELLGDRFPDDLDPRFREIMLKEI